MVWKVKIATEKAVGVRGGAGAINARYPGWAISQKGDMMKTVLIVAAATIAIVSICKGEEKLVTKADYVRALEDREATIAKLTKENKALQEQLGAKDREIKELKALLQEHGVKLSKSRQTANRASVDDSVVIDAEFFGVRLGERLAEVKKKYPNLREIEALRKIEDLWKIEDLKREDLSNDVVQRYSYQADSEQVEAAYIEVHRDRVFEIDVYLKDPSIDKLNGIEAVLRAKYDVKGSSYYEGIKEFSIEFDKEDKLGKKTVTVTTWLSTAALGPATLHVGYTHDALKKAAKKEQEDKAASSVGDQL